MTLLSLSKRPVKVALAIDEPKYKADDIIVEDGKDDEGNDPDEVDENRLFDLFKAVLLAHIGTKTVDSQFHSKSEGFYTVLFDAFHQIKEKEQDTEDDKPMDLEEAAQTAYDSLEKAKEIIDGMICEKNKPGMDNLLRGLYDKLEFACGDARAFLKK
jgi:hypothetical protein